MPIATDVDRPATGHRLTVGAWHVDPAANEVVRGARRVRIEPKAMQVLVALASSAGQVVSRDDLLSRVWPGVVVGDEALTQTIIKLRRALGDDRRAPAYIETISKRGYRLIAAVARVPDGPTCPDAPGGPAGDADPSPSGPSSGDPPSARTSPAAPSPAPARIASGPARWAALLAASLLASLLAWASMRPGTAPPHRAGPPTDVRIDAPVTVAVMPFEPPGADRDQAWFAHGLSSDLATALAGVPGLQVIRPGTNEAPTAARHLVQGSVQRSDGSVRITVRLVDTIDGGVLWAGRYDRAQTELFALQDEIVERLVALLPAKLTDATRRRLARRHTRSLEAYDLFLRAQSMFLVRRVAENATARELYRKAIELDPSFARAYAGVAMTWAIAPRLDPQSPVPEATVRARELAESARLINPDLPEVHWALAFVAVQERRHDAAIERLKNAIALNPSFADAYALLGGVYTYVGQPRRTIPLLRTALRLDPGGGYLHYMILGRAYLYSDDLEQALINLREAVTRNPSDVESRVHLAATLAAGGDLRGAEWEGIEVRALDPDFEIRSWLRTYPMANGPLRDRLHALLQLAGL